MDDSTTTGQRQHERPVVNGEATIQAASSQTTGPLVNVSEGGLQVLCRFPGTVGESVEVCFTPEGYPKLIRAQGKVTRLGPDRVGIEFTQLFSWQPIWREISEFYAVGGRQD